MPKLNGWRGAGLLIMGLTCLFRGWRYTFDIPYRLPPGIDQLSLAGVITQWLGIGWFIAAVLGIVYAFRLHDRVGIFALAFMHALWSAALVLGWAKYGGSLMFAVTTLGVFGLIVCWSRMVNPPRAEVLDRLNHDQE